MIEEDLAEQPENYYVTMTIHGMGGNRMNSVMKVLTAIGMAVTGCC